MISERISPDGFVYRYSHPLGLARRPAGVGAHRFEPVSTEQIRAMSTEESRHATEVIDDARANPGRRH